MSLKAVTKSCGNKLWKGMFNQIMKTNNISVPSDL